MLARRRRPSFAFADDIAVLFDRQVTAEAILRFGSHEDGSTVSPSKKKQAAAGEAA